MKLNINGEVIIDEFFCASAGKGGRIYALGDVAASKDSKQGYPAGQQALGVAANILAAVAGRPPKALKPLGNVILVSLGPRDGVANLMGSIFNSACMMSNMKAKDLFVTKCRKDHGV